MDANRRRRTRVVARVAATFTQGGKSSIPLMTRNISLKGLLAEPAHGAKAETEGAVRIRLGSAARIVIACRILRSDATGVAVDFLSMDAKSFRHLRNLVRYNAADADGIDGELRTPAFPA